MTPPNARQTFTLYAAQGRVYASNVRQKLVDLGSLAQEPSCWRYQLDGNGATGAYQASARDALQDLAASLTFLYLDGQFTALADVRGRTGPSLDGAPRVELTLDELGKGEPAVDVNV